MNQPPTNSPQPVCPFIGLAKDPGSLIAYPSHENFCNNCHPALIPTFEHQEKLCLTNQHEACPAYQSGVLPLDARHISNSSPKKSNSLLQKTWLPVTLLIIFSGLIFAGWSFFKTINQSNELPAPLVQVTIHPTQEIIPTLQPTVEPALTETSVVTEEPTILPATPSPEAAINQPDVLRRMYVPLGPQGQQFVIHRILDGDNLDILLRRYGTSLVAVQAINPRVPLPIWIDFVLIFPYNNTDVIGQPYLKGIEISQENISIDDLALELKVDADVLKSLNDCPNGCTLFKSDWVLVPTQAYIP